MNVLIFVIYVFIIELLVFLWLRYLSRLEQGNAKLQMNLSYEKQYKELTDEALESIRKYRHDLAKHIQVMEHLQEKDAGLPALIAAMKEQECREKNIKFSQDVPEQMKLAMSDQDQTSLLVNLLDNAIEANEKIEEISERKIILHVEDGNKVCRIILENTIQLAKDQTFSLQTEKEEKQNHGFGTKIIGEVVNKYHGSLAYLLEKDDKSLKVIVELPCKEGNAVPEKIINRKNKNHDG